METLTISHRAILFVEHARQYYRKAGAETSEVHSLQTALRPLASKCRREKASQFGPKRLKAVRDAMIALNGSRTGIDRRESRRVHLYREQPFGLASNRFNTNRAGFSLIGAEKSSGPHQLVENRKHRQILRGKKATPVNDHGNTTTAP